MNSGSMQLLKEKYMWIHKTYQCPVGLQGQEGPEITYAYQKFAENGKREILHLNIAGYTLHCFCTQPWIMHSF